jgi:hypothetical protein
MSSLTPPPLPPRNRLVTLLIGIGVANLVGGVLCFGVTMLFSLYNNRFEGAIAYPSFILLPLIVGLVAAWFYRRLNRGSRHYLSRRALGLTRWCRRRGDSSSRRRRLPGHSLPRALWAYFNRIAHRPDLVSAGL